MSKKLYSFILYHSIISLIIYYLLLLTADILFKGAVSHVFKISLLLVSALILAFILAFLEKKITKNSTGKLVISKKLISAFLIFASLLLFGALAPHDLLTAGILALAIPLLFFLNRKYLLE